MKSPPKEKRGLDTALKTAELLKAYRLFLVLQAAPLGKINGAHVGAWEREAGRLLREYWRTGNPKHLYAFVTHSSAMRAHNMLRGWTR